MQFSIKTSFIQDVLFVVQKSINSKYTEINETDFNNIYL